MREEEQRETGWCLRCVSVFWGGGGPALGEDCGNKPKNKKDAHSALKCKEEDKVGEQQMPRTTRKPPHLE